MKYQNKDLQKEEHKSSLDISEERILTPEEGSKICQEAKEAGERFRQYMQQRKKMEEERQTAKAKKK